MSDGKGHSILTLSFGHTLGWIKDTRPGHSTGNGLIRSRTYNDVEKSTTQTLAIVFGRITLNKPLEGQTNGHTDNVKWFNCILYR